MNNSSKDISDLHRRHFVSYGTLPWDELVPCFIPTPGKVGPATPHICGGGRWGPEMLSYSFKALKWQSQD